MASSIVNQNSDILTFNERVIKSDNPHDFKLEYYDGISKDNLIKGHFKQLSQYAY